MCNECSLTNTFKSWGFVLYLVHIENIFFQLVFITNNECNKSHMTLLKLTKIGELIQRNIIRMKMTVNKKHKDLEDKLFIIFLAQITLHF